MKIMHHTFTPDGLTEIEAREITGWSHENQFAMRRYEKAQTKKNPKCVFRLSMTPEDSDGLFYENVPAWKQKLAASILHEAQQVGMAEKIGQRTH